MFKLVPRPASVVRHSNRPGITERVKFQTVPYCPNWQYGTHTSNLALHDGPHGPPSVKCYSIRTVPIVGAGYVLGARTFVMIQSLVTTGGPGTHNSDGNGPSGRFHRTLLPQAEVRSRHRSNQGYWMFAEFPLVCPSRALFCIMI